jgi:hypothetical protein
MARPMPRDPPVTMHTGPAQRSSSVRGKGHREQYSTDVTGATGCKIIIYTSNIQAVLIREELIVNTSQGVGLICMGTLRSI